MARTKLTRRKFLELIAIEQPVTGSVPIEPLVGLCGSGSEPVPVGSEIDQSLERRNSKRRKKAEKRNQRKSSGFGLLARSDVRNQGYVVPIGSERTCLPDSVWVLLNLLDVTADQTSVRDSLKPADEAQRDPNIDEAVSFCRSQGVMLTYQEKLAGSPVYLFRELVGVFLVRMELVTPDGSDFHVVTFHARTGRLFDNEPMGKVPVIMFDDRVSTAAALKVFQHMFPRAQKIILRGVWRGDRITQDDLCINH